MANNLPQPSVSYLRIAVLSRKGGVGKTTSAIHLAAHLAVQGHDTLLIDGDDRAYATTWVSSGELPFTVDGVGGLMRVGEFGAVVIDSQADPSEQEISTLGRNVSHIVLPTVPEAQSINGLAQTVAVLDRAGVPRDRLAVLITMDTRVGSATAEAREAQAGQGLRVLNRTIRDTVAFRHASGQGVLVGKVGSPAGRLAWADYGDALRELLA